MAFENKDNFAERIARLENRETVAVKRSSSVDYKLASDYGKKKTGLSKWLLLKTVLVVILSLFMFRVGAITMGADLAARQAELKEGSSGEKVAAVLLGSMMVADSWLLPLLGAQGGNISTASIQSSGDGSTVVRRPSMVVNSVPAAPGTKRLKTVSVSKPSTGDALGEPVPVAQTMSSKFFESLRMDSDMKPDLYFPSPSEGWFMIKASDLEYEAEPYYLQKQSWEKAQEQSELKRAWRDLPLLKQLLQNQDNARIGAFKEDYAWYVHRETAQATMLRVAFDHDAKEPTEFDKRVANKMLTEETVNASLALRAKFSFKVADVPYKKKTLRDPADIARLNFLQVGVREYSSQLSPQVKIQAWSTASQADVEALLVRIDYDALKVLFEGR